MCELSLTWILRLETFTSTAVIDTLNKLANFN